VVALAIANIRDVWVTSLALRSLGLTTIALQPHHRAPTLPASALRAVIVSGRETWPGLEAVCRGRDAALIAISAYGGDALPPDRARPNREGGHILQTSGTTGTLKFVRFDPAFEPAYFDQRRRANGVNAETVINLFDLAAWTGAGYKSPVSAWGVGASVVIHQQPDIHLALARPGVNVSVLVPSMLRLILAAPEGAFPRLPHMRLSVTGGALTTAEMAQARARITPRIDNGLGATESLCIAYTPMDTPDDHRWHIPAPDTLVEIVDDAGQAIPNGQMGRLRVTTAGAPKGYLDDQEATCAFFDDGFFYPGDLAVRRDDGRIALMGRVTDVINVR
jgi:acyl-coenzyme A synthetase/AMP-(fatty) acid ligase